MEGTNLSITVIVFRWKAINSCTKIRQGLQGIEEGTTLIKRVCVMTQNLTEIDPCPVVSITL